MQNIGDRNKIIKCDVLDEGKFVELEEVGLVQRVDGRTLVVNVRKENVASNIGLW